MYIYINQAIYTCINQQEKALYAHRLTKFLPLTKIYLCNRSKHHYHYDQPL